MSALFPQTFSIDQGRDFAFTAYWQDPTTAPINLTGYTATFSLAADYAQTPIVTLTAGSGITITPLLGEVDVTLTGAQTDLLTGSGYVAELVLTSGSGYETSLLKGYIGVSKKVVV